MDHAIIRDLFGSVIEAGNDARHRCTASRAACGGAGEDRAEPDRAMGQLQEWLEDRDDSTNEHRHVSHLWGLHPGREITARGTPQLYAAARRSLTFRGDGGTGWSMAWKINFWARLHDGDHAHRLLANLLTLTGSRATEYKGGGVYPNLFDAHPAVSDRRQLRRGGRNDRDARAEPRWRDRAAAGAAVGVARGAGHGDCVRAAGFDVALSWRDRRLVEATIISRLGNPLTVRYGDEVRRFSTTRGQRIVVRM
jgi:alpha-L-fucosidase 2